MARCPYLAFKWDPLLSALNPTLDHRCHAAGRPASIEEQVEVCLTAEYPACSSYRMPQQRVFPTVQGGTRFRFPLWLLMAPGIGLIVGVIISRG